MQLETSGAVAHIAGGNMEVNDSGGAAFISGGDLHVTNGGGAGFLARGDVNVTNGGGAVLAAGRDLSVAYAPTSFPAGALLLAARNAWIHNGHIGVLISSRAVVDSGSQVLVQVQLPHFFGTLIDKALSLADGALGWLEG
jgi:hypothetical protein